MKVRKGDTVEVIAGDDKGERGTVHRVIPGRKAIRGHTPKGVRVAALDPERDRLVVSGVNLVKNCLLYTSPSPRDRTRSRMPSSA